MCSNTFPAVCACADVCARVVCLHKWQVCLRVSVCVCVCAFGRNWRMVIDKCVMVFRTH